MSKYTKFEFKKNALKQLNLPIVDYPIPFDRVKVIYRLPEKEINPTILIYWIMDYMNHNIGDREYYEKALLDICENHAPLSNKTEFWFNAVSKYSQNPDKIWSVKLGKVNLFDPIVTYQCGDNIQLAVTRSKEDKTKIETSFYTVPHQELIASIRCFSIDSHIKMLTNPKDANSFAGFQYQTSKPYNSLYEGEIKDVMVNWEYGLGYKSKDTFDKKYEYAMHLNPIPNEWVAFLFNIVLQCEKNKLYEKIIGNQQF